MSFLTEYAAWLIAAGLIISAGYGWHRSIVNSEVKIAKNAVELSYRVQIDEQRKRLVAKVTTAEDKLGLDIQTAYKEKDAEIIKLNSTVANLTYSLRNRLPSPASGRASDVTCTTSDSTKVGATGLQLSEPHAKFLIGFAGDTAELQQELKASLKREEIVREALKGFFK